jgi:hypothetical protein
MGVKANIPLGVAIKGVKLAKGGVVSLVAPSEPPILKMDLVKFTTLKRRPEAVDAATIRICLVFVSSATNLIEISES